MGYRMIIADDEEMLIRLIRKLGHFEELGVEVVDECRNGEDAYNSIVKNHPDFVLTDIQMPVLDGLELIDKVCQTNADILFVLLSGYRYFEYAQSAIRLNVVDYLLKPVDENQLNLILERLCRLTDERRRREQEQASFRRMCDSQKEEKQQRFWQEVTARDHTLDLVAFQPQNLERNFEIILPQEKVQMLFLNTIFSEDASMAMLSFLEDLNRNVDNAFAGKALHYPYNTSFGFFVLLNYDSQETQGIRNAISAFYYSCREQWEKYLDFPLTLGISRCCNAPGPLQDLVHEAITAVWGRMVFSGSPTIRYEQLLSMTRFQVEDILTETRGRKIRDSIHYLNHQELTDVFSAMRKELTEYRYAFPGDVLELYLEVREQILAGVSKECRKQVHAQCSSVAWRARDGGDMIQKLYSVTENYVVEQKKVLEAKNRKPVELAMEYVHKNFSGDISLESTAEAVGLSTAYLSRVFKENNGMGFNDYITQIRMEESKRLLANTNIPVRDVAGAVGYLDEKYYSKLFKKQFGIKPTEYRKLYG